MDEGALTEPLLAAVERWAANHPRKSEPLLQIFGAAQRYSPLEIAHELRAQTPTGKLLVRVFRNATVNHSVDDLIGWFEKASDASVAADIAVRP